MPFGNASSLKSAKSRTWFLARYTSVDLQTKNTKSTNGHRYGEKLKLTFYAQRKTIAVMKAKQLMEEEQLDGRPPFRVFVKDNFMCRFQFMSQRFGHPSRVFRVRFALDDTKSAQQNCHEFLELIKPFATIQYSDNNSSSQDMSGEFSGLSQNCSGSFSNSFSASQPAYSFMDDLMTSSSQPVQTVSDELTNLIEEKSRRWSTQMPAVDQHNQQQKVSLNAPPTLSRAVSKRLLVSDAKDDNNNNNNNKENLTSQSAPNLMTTSGIPCRESAEDLFEFDSPLFDDSQPPAKKKPTPIVEGKNVDAQSQPNDVTEDIKGNFLVLTNQVNNQSDAVLPRRVSVRKSLFSEGSCNSTFLNDPTENDSDLGGLIMNESPIRPVVQIPPTAEKVTVDADAQTDQPSTIATESRALQVNLEPVRITIDGHDTDYERIVTSVAARDLQHRGRHRDRVFVVQVKTDVFGILRTTTRQATEVLAKFVDVNHDDEGDLE